MQITNEISSLMNESGLSQKDITALVKMTPLKFESWKNNKTKLSPHTVEKVSDLVKSINRQSEIEFPNFRYIDLFAGIGGFRRAFDSIGGHCVFTSEWDANSNKTYAANFTSDHEIEGDICKFTSSRKALKTIPDFDVLVAGFPCQPFSIAGVSKKNSLGRSHGFECDTQGTLFFDIAKIIKHHKPAAFLLENVKNLISHDKGNTFKIIARTLREELGYTVNYQVVDGSAWVPQKRKRIMIVGFKKNNGFNFDGLESLQPSTNPTLGTILHGVEHKEEDEFPFTIKGKVNEKYILTENLWRYLQDYKAKHKAAGNGFGFGLVGPNDIARTLSARYYKDGSEVLIRRGSRGRPRRLTPRECARLMGFDGPGQSNFKIPVSDTQAYKQFGNSVIVPMATSIAQLMKPGIMESVGNQRVGTSTAFYKQHSLRPEIV